MAVVLVLVAIAVCTEWRPRSRDRWRASTTRLTALQRTNAEARFLAGMASELRAGAALRAAFEAAADRAPELQLGWLVRLSAVGVPISSLADGVAANLAQNGMAAAAAMRVADETGGETASMFESLAQVAAEDRALYRELRAATAQAKVSSLVVGGLPVLFLMWQAATGRLGELASTGLGFGILSLGLALLAAGAATVGVLLRGAMR